MLVPDIQNLNKTLGRIYRVTYHDFKTAQSREEWHVFALCRYRYMLVLKIERRWHQDVHIKGND